MERMRKEFLALPKSDRGRLKRKEFDEAVEGMNNSKAVGIDEIPEQVWKNSKVVKETLFEFLQ